MNKITDSYKTLTDEFGKYPLQAVAIDHICLDANIIDEETSKVIGRPRLSIGLDLYSRCIYGYYISVDPPSTNSIMKVVQCGLFPKNTKEQYSTVNEWGIYGKPATIIIDDQLRHTVEKEGLIKKALGTTIIHVPGRMPTRNYLEKFFRKLNIDLFHNLTLADGRTIEEACYTMPKLKSLLVKYIVDVYHVRPHRSLPNFNTPMAMYHHGVLKYGIPPQIEPENEEKVKQALMPKVTRSYNRNGVNYMGIIYKSPKLPKMIGKKKKLVDIKYDDDDISRVYILNPETKEYVDVPAAAPQADAISGMTRYYFKWLKKEVTSPQRQLLSDFPAIIQATEKIKELKEKGHLANHLEKMRVQQADNLPEPPADPQDNTPQNDSKTSRDKGGE